MKNKMLIFFIEISLLFMMLNVSTIYSYYFASYSKLFLLLGCLLAFFSSVVMKNFKINRKIAIIYIFWALIVVAISCFRGFSASSINYLIKLAVMAILVNNIIKLDLDPLNILYKITKIFTFWALFNYIFMDVFHIRLLPSVAEYLTDWGYSYKLYLGCLMENTQHIVILGNVGKRLHVPFSEPGVAQLFINYTLFYTLFLKNRLRRSDKLTVIICMLCVVLSTSFIGVAIMGSIIFLYFFKKKRYKLLLIITVISAIVGSVLIFDKLSSISYSDRSSDLIKMINDSFKNLPFGVGIGNLDNLDQRINIQTGLAWENSNFCGLISPLLYFGIFSVIYYYFLYCACRCNNSKMTKIDKFCFSIMLLLTLFTEPLCLTSFYSYLEINGLINKFLHNKL